VDTPPGRFNSTPSTSSYSKDDHHLRGVTQNSSSKRVKFINSSPLDRDKPLYFDASVGAGSSGSGEDPHYCGGGPPISSQSILEQMNQTEKRFLPPPPPSPIVHSKRVKTVHVPSPMASSGQGGLSMRKRRSEVRQLGIIHDEDEDAAAGAAEGEYLCLAEAGDSSSPKTKSGRFCQCNDCYVELSGGPPQQHGHGAGAAQEHSKSVGGGPREMPKCLDISRRSEKSFCDKEVSVDLIGVSGGRGRDDHETSTFIK